MTGAKDTQPGPAHCAARQDDGRSGEARPPGPDSVVSQAPSYDTFDQAYQRGWNARTARRELGTNPYDSCVWPELFAAWAAGWRGRAPHPGPRGGGTAKAGPRDLGGPGFGRWAVPLHGGLAGMG